MEKGGDRGGSKGYESLFKSSNNDKQGRELPV